MIGLCQQNKVLKIIYVFKQNGIAESLIADKSLKFKALYDR